jgi:hypothetical protein
MALRKKSEFTKDTNAFVMIQFRTRIPHNHSIGPLPFADSSSILKPGYTRHEIFKISAACSEIGRSSYERRRARAMVLLMRYAGLRISDVVTLERNHIRGTYLMKRAVKNHHPPHWHLSRPSPWVDECYCLISHDFLAFPRCAKIYFVFVNQPITGTSIT